MWYEFNWGLVKEFFDNLFVFCCVGVYYSGWLNCVWYEVLDEEILNNIIDVNVVIC